MNLPRLGMGTWHVGEDPAKRSVELAALRLGLELGIELIDTAEMYGEGGAERIVGEAIHGRRDRAFLVSKFYPHHASRPRLVAACKASLLRLRTDSLDLYLYHWRGPVPLDETVATLEELAADGMIRRWGVSNFDVDDMEELFEVAQGERCAANQVLYNLAKRGIEYDLLPWCAKHGVAVMAYSALDEGRLAKHPTVVAIARRLGITPARVALAWVLRDPHVAALAKASTADHVRDNREALGARLDGEALQELDLAFPPPRHKLPLAMY
jgi:diketogulonate reductase-like aldo/keto reductase